jgi:hypothetical protein
MAGSAELDAIRSKELEKATKSSGRPSISKAAKSETTSNKVSMKEMKTWTPEQLEQYYRSQGLGGGAF